jgi:hypothetical protein
MTVVNKSSPSLIKMNAQTIFQHRLAFWPPKNNSTDENKNAAQGCYANDDFSDGSAVMVGRSHEQISVKTLNSSEKSANQR